MAAANRKEGSRRAHSTLRTSAQWFTAGIPMSDLKLFQVGRDAVTEIPGQSVAVEKSL
jgi:hypothetical protein